MLPPRGLGVGVPGFVPGKGICNPSPSVTQDLWLEGIFSPVQIPKPLLPTPDSGTYGAVFLASLILRDLFCRLVCRVYTHTYANRNYLFNTHMCIRSLDFTRLTSCRLPPKSTNRQGQVQTDQLGQGCHLPARKRADSLNNPTTLWARGIWKQGQGHLP